MEENLKAKNLIAQIKTLCGRTLNVDEAKHILTYDEVAIENAVDVLSSNVKKGSVIGNAFRYLSTVLSQPAPAVRTRGINPKGGNPASGLLRNATGTRAPSGMPSTYSLDSMPRLTAQQAYEEIEKIELHGNSGLDTLLGKETADKLRFRVCTNITARTDWNVLG